VLPLFNIPLLAVFVTAVRVGAQAVAAARNHCGASHLLLSLISCALVMTG